MLEIHSLESNHLKNKRIARNTVFLYLRMLIQLCVGLYASRLVLHALGVSDYGIYNVVGGVVAIFSFINGSMGTATNRFLAYELGNRIVDKVKMRKVFSTALIIHICVALLFGVLCETIGLWYMYNILVVPPERLTAAIWVYQFSIVTSVISIINVPYDATIVAHEKMSAFAYISIIEATLLLLIALFIDNTTLFDRLVLYGLLLLLSQLFLRFIYIRYCHTNFEEVKGHFYFDKGLFKEMSSFAFWILNGCIAVVGYTQGINLLLNYFFGPSVNAARGIAVIVQTKVMAFCNNFQRAVNPQIIKSYADGNLQYMHQLVCNSSVFSFYLIFLLSLPVIIECDNILKIWLTDVPHFSSVFVRLTLCVGIIDTLRMPLNTSIHATGSVKLFQIIEGTTSLLILPVAYIFLKVGFSPVSVFVVQLIFFVLIQIERIYIVCPAIKMEKMYYIKNVFIKVMGVVILSLIIPIIFHNNVIISNVYIDILINIVMTLLSTTLVIYFIGINRNMRNRINKSIIKIIKL